MKRILVTGGCGFIGSHFVRRMLTRHPELEVVNLDALTYAGNPRNLEDVADDPRYRFVRGSISDPDAVADAAEGCEAIVNFAAETHVDRSIHAGYEFVTSNVIGPMTTGRAGMPCSRASFSSESTLSGFSANFVAGSISGTM